jgi:hypothetical protein
MRFNLEDLPKNLREQAIKQISKNRDSDTDAVLEQAASGQSVAKKKDTRPDTQHRATITVHSIRKRLLDPDGCSAKAAIDTIVREGNILIDDSAKYVKEVRFTQEKGKEEKTIITIDWK